MAIVLFGISGSIAAYRALEVMRLLVSDGVDVIPVLSEGGEKFVTRHTVEALTRHRAVTEIFPKVIQQEIEHVSLADKADLLVTCPASADILAKYATGICDDPLALTALTFGTPHIIAPAMNFRMWEHPATVANVSLLKERGCKFVGPDKGMMACGEEGWGRLARIEEIYGYICAELGSCGPLKGKKVLVSAGGTREAIDDVRYIGNRSSGRMGLALAEAARNMGASVVLVTASQITPPSAVKVIKVESAKEMHDAILKEASNSDIIAMAAAVADFTPKKPVKGKIKKSDGLGPIDLTPTADILSELGAKKKSGRILIGFAAEYGSKGKDEAVRKCRDKKCDLLCLNDVARTDIGFDTEDNEITLVFPDGAEKKIPKASKRAVAVQILSEAAALFPKVNKS
jgi:phosphopantothenoylcysteine decarboxylase / phosphopantothenate---cysteine ligase